MKLVLCFDWTAAHIELALVAGKQFLKKTSRGAPCKEVGHKQILLMELPNERLGTGRSLSLLTASSTCVDL